VSELTEALERCAKLEADGQGGGMYLADGEVLVDAARRWAALGLRDGTSVNWCQQHRDIAIDDEEGPDVCWFIMFAYKGTGADWENPPNHLPCRLVPAVLVLGSTR